MDDRYNPDEITDDTLDGRDATIFLVDASAPMFKKTSLSVDDVEAEPTIDDCPFTLAIRRAFNTLRNKIFTSPYDSVAIVLFGTKKAKPNEKYGVYSNTYLLQDLQKPDCDPILQLDEMLNKDGGSDEYVYAVNQQSISLADALWLCSSIFSKHKSKKDNKKIFFFTNNDEPHSKFSNKQKQELLMSNEGGGILSGSMTADELLSKICLKGQKKRPVANLVFNLDSDTKFGVKLYNLIRPAPTPKRMQLDKRTNEIVKSVTTKFNAETAETLLPSELMKSTTVCGEKVRLDKNDLTSLKSKFAVGFTLLGFKPIEKLKFHLYLSPASFIYPDEDLVKGCRFLFGVLMDRCQVRGLAPLCILKCTAATKPRIVALLPHAEKDPEQPSVFGSHVIYLPFLNDVRKFNYVELVGSTPVLKDEGKCHNSKILLSGMNETKWKTLEGLALSREDVESVDDLALGQRSTLFNDLVFPLGYQPHPSQSSVLTPRDPQHEATVEAAARNGWVRLTLKQF
ncbi:hypothetical protein GHT06_017555 [Daphnia sinensis]|uniref:Ku domain-containing protein n=1 Tax=Daphnia sinensis TaxID=1820382 RepID=A0AAD5L7V3_9CRUS|nr:hypothetical protein GHT06_017555 [Daphnia sinensis]